MEKPTHAVLRMMRWFNSIHAHMLMMSLGVIAAITAISVSLLLLVYTPQPYVSVYEMSRIVRGLPLVRDVGSITVGQTTELPPLPTEPSERAASTLLAAYLGLPADRVRVALSDVDRGRNDEIVGETRLYGPEHFANPDIRGSFSIALRNARGWRIYTRRSTNVLGVWRQPGWQALFAGILLAIPLTYWFSARLVRPIQAFAASAEQLQGGQKAVPVPVAGPSEIRRAARAFNDMQARIEGYVRQRTTLVGAIAHDLRAPLSRLHFHLFSAPDRIKAAAEQEIQEMEHLVDVVLAFVESDVRPMQVEPLDLGMLVEGVADDFTDLGRDVSIKRSDRIIVPGDPLLLKRLFVNIIDNAVTYGNSAEILIRNGGAEAVVVVEDRGSGMTGEEFSRAFEPFFRGEPSRNRSTGGVGLGLSIVKSAADAHGATVSMSNRQDGGLSVEVRLPTIVKPTASHPAAATPQEV